LNFELKTMNYELLKIIKRNPFIKKTWLQAAVCLLLTGCGRPPEWIRDVAELEQNALAYVDPGTADVRMVSASLQDSLCRDADRRFFSVWDPDRPAVPAGDAAWGFDRLSKARLYGENRKPRPAGWTDGMARNAGLGGYPNRNEPGITVDAADLRLLPTKRPSFYDFDLPGEGFPFDAVQQSSVPPNTPLRILHRSVDGDWLFVDSPVASGWIPGRDAAAADWAFLWQWNTGRTAAVTADDAAVRAADGRFLFRAPAGTVFPVLSADSLGLRVLAAAAGADGRAEPVEALLPAGTASVRPLPLTPRLLAQSVNAQLGQAYGWGGLYGDRDCSSAVRDVFIPFGLLLPRNSAAQAAAGDSSVDLSGLPPDRKERAIRTGGIPFLTLLHLRGHIMLYVGSAGSRACVFHNLWGIRTRSFWGKEGRYVVGQAVITTLSPGRELRNADRSADLLRRVDRMTFLVNPDSVAAVFGNRVPSSGERRVSGPAGAKSGLADR
jgi:hypothetical protein